MEKVHSAYQQAVVLHVNVWKVLSVIHSQVPHVSETYVHPLNHVPNHTCVLADVVNKDVMELFAELVLIAIQIPIDVCVTHFSLEIRTSYACLVSYITTKIIFYIF